MPTPCVVVVNSGVRFEICMSFKTKLTALLFITIVARQVSLTGSDKLMKGYNWTGPNSGPLLRKQADQARTTLYFMAGASFLGILMRNKKQN